MSGMVRAVSGSLVPECAFAYSRTCQIIEAIFDDNNAGLFQLIQGVVVEISGVLFVWSGLSVSLACVFHSLVDWDEAASVGERRIARHVPIRIAFSADYVEEVAAREAKLLA